MLRLCKLYLGIIAFSLLFVSRLNAMCPNDSVYIDAYVEVEPFKSVLINIQDQLPGSTFSGITQEPKLGNVIPSGKILTYTSTADKITRDTFVCRVVYQSNYEYIRYIVHIKSKTGGEGTDFWFAFMENQPDLGNKIHLYVDIITTQRTNVHIESPKVGYSNDLVLNVGLYRFNAEDIWMCVGTDIIQNTGIHITSDCPISVVAGSFSPNTVDATTLLPTSALGTEYTIATPNEIMNPEFCVVATEPSTQVTIIPSIETDAGHPAGQPFNLTLEPGEAFQLQYLGDLYTSFSGSRVVANKPIAVFEGSKCTFYPVLCDACDHNFEQCLPHKFWGKHYAYVTMSTLRDYYKVTARYDNTEVLKNGKPLVILNAGQSYEDCVWEESAIFDANQPIAFSQFMSAYSLNGKGDPSILNLRPMESGVEYAVFNMPEGDSINNPEFTKIIIVAGKEVAPGITLDGEPVTGFKSFKANDSLQYAIIKGKSFGVHKIESQYGIFSGTCSATGYYESYCYQIAPAVVPLMDTLVVVSESSCSNSSYRFAGCDLTESGVYTDTLFSPNWRDSIVELHLTVNESYLLDTSKIVPYNSSFTWLSHSLTNITNDTLLIDTLVTLAGCDSVVRMWVQPLCGVVDTNRVADNICSNHLPYIWHTYKDNPIYFDGIYTDTLLEDGCVKTIYLLTLSTRQADSIHIKQTRCKNQVPFSWNGQTISTTGQYTAYLTNKEGCDSIVTLDFYISKFCNPDIPLNPIVDCLDTTYSLVDTTFCEETLLIHPFLWFGNYYSEPGEYHDTIIGGNIYGCDSIGTLLLKTVICPCDTMRVETDTIVPYQEKLQYLWFGQMRDSAGVYRDTIETVDGCDSIGTLILRTSYSDEQTICQPDSAIFETPWGKIGVHHDSICIDTILLKHDTINLVYARLCVTREECSCDTMRDTTDITLPYDTLKAQGGYMWFGQMRDSAGVYRDTIETVEGCDSIGLLILRVAYERDTFVCGDDTAVFKTPWGEIGLDSCECKEGWIRKTADNEGLVWAKLCAKHLGTDTVREDTTLCYGTSIVWHGITIDQTKEYEYHEPFTRLMTCDSVVYYLDATIKPEPQPHKTIDAVCAGETYIWTTYRDSIIEGPGTYYDTLWTDHGCYSDYYELELTHKALSIGANDTTVCGLPVVWEDSTWYESGVKTKILKNAVGCDSVVTLTLYVNEPTDQKDQDTIVCYGETIFWRNRLWKDLTKDSTLRDTLKYNGSPCDSIRYERLVRVRAQVKDSVSCEYACYGADVEWRGQKVMNITATQILTDMVAYKGTTCDSIHFEHTILVQKADTLPEYKTICYGQTYHWKRNGKQDSIVSTSGIYKDTVRYAATGCDSAIYVLDLKVDAINKDSVNQTTCQGTPYLWRGKELTIDSIYRDTATAKTSAECDTVYILKLTVNPILYGTPEEQTICEGDSILWSGKYYKEAGTYKDTMASVITGCDSIISLVLSTKKCCPDPIVKPTEVVNMCDTLLPYTWHTYRDILVDRDTLLTDTLRTERGCDSIIYILNLTTYHCCRPNMAATMEVMDVCADATVMDVIVDLSSGEFDRYRVHYDNAPGNKMPFRDTMITLPTYYGQTEHILLNPPVPHDAIDRTNYPRPDEYAMTITLYNACGDSLNLGKQTFDVRYPSWILDQHWDDVIAILNDRYNGGYTFSRVEWLRDDEILAGEDELYIYLPHQLWTSPQGQYHDYYYQARLTRADDGKTMITCPMVPHHIDSTNVLTEPYVAVTPTLVHQENPIVYVQTNTKGTYWVYDTTGKLLQTADYEPTDHNVFDIQLYNVQTMYILVFTPREETKPLQEKYRVVKVLVE